MKTTVAISLAALALMAAACHKAQDQDSASASGDSANASASPGGGGDEKITLAQFQQRRVERLMRDDANKDGKVSKDEFVQAMQARIAERNANGGGGDDSGNAPDPQAIADRIFPRMDTNGDGFITKDEIEKSSADQFARLDTGHKGYITRDQMRPPGGFGGGGPGGPGGGGGQGGGDNGGGGQGGGGGGN